MQNQIKNDILSMCQQLLTLIAKETSGFFTNDIVSVFLNFSKWANYIVFAISLLFMLFDIAEEHASGKDVDYSVVFGNAIKAIIFAQFNSSLAIMSMTIADILTTKLNFQIPTDPDQIFNAIIQGYSVSVSFTILMLLAVLIGTIVFFVMSVMRYGAMFIQILSSSLYISDIVRGDTTSIGSWLRHTVAISVTYILQYITFYCGLYFMAQQDIIMWAVMWAAMVNVSKILQKFGYSTGTRGFFGATGSLASRGVSFGLQLASKV